MTEISKLEYAYELLPGRLLDVLAKVSAGEKEHITELRLRRERFFSAVLYGKEYFFTADGRLMVGTDEAVYVGAADIEFVFQKIFKGSVHAFPRELAGGYITCTGGNRAGFCGTAVTLDSCITSVKYISSINIRIAREVRGCSAQIFDKAFSQGRASLIVASPPCGGKTTVLRDLCRELSTRYKVSLIDERGEIAAVHEGETLCDVGARTDIFNGYPRLEAISAAVRAMSPDILICDEIGAKSDIQALEYAVSSGVNIVCSCHAPDIDELKKRPAAGRLIKSGVFDCAAILGTGAMCGKLISFYKLK